MVKWNPGDDGRGAIKSMSTWMKVPWEDRRCWFLRIKVTIWMDSQENVDVK